MDFKEIEVFLKVVEYKRLTDVAESLGMTQPGVSNILKRIEREVGAPLFIRQGRTLVPSIQGRIFYEAARNQWFSLRRSMSSMDPALSNRREVVIAAAVSSDWFFRMAGDFSRSHPEVRLVFQSEKYIPQNHRLSAAEFLLLPASGLQDEKSMPVDYQDGLYVILRKDHPLAQERIIPLQRLRESDFVFVLREDGDYEQCYWDCFNAGFLPNISLAVNSRLAKYAAIRSGCGVGLVYDSELSMAADIRDCVSIPVRGGGEGKTICLGWYDDHLSEAGRGFLRWARRAAGQNEG